ncbi:glycoside hydrolase [Delitschia confertaspora ATCC 74209]|uniref:glucan 1,3-beta-glucosidase n=1 Tax=Delitschia confertaspora ATCC 74209 TaxID=1513339 RepID=A0A9P4JT13_9PLEO|nr:glycoside hydrolase [Delitschia confertaspora ATCC 74209]
MVAVNAWLPYKRDLLGERVNKTNSSLLTAQGHITAGSSPTYDKIRGVNLGSLFVVEPWMIGQEWASMGCAPSHTESGCVTKLGRDRADKVFQKHWDTWITEDDINTIQSYGLNTVRVPLGYWIIEEAMVGDNVQFPRGALYFLDRLMGWCANRKIYVILDLHGAPGAQVKEQPSTGQWALPASFFDQQSYARANKFLEVLTRRIHTNLSYRTVGMLEVLNEPETGHKDLLAYYRTAYATIRNAERELQIKVGDQLDVQYMNAGWGAGNAGSVLKGEAGVVYDSHRYLKWDPSVKPNKDSYIRASCTDNVAKDGGMPVVVGEWSLAVADSVEKTADFDVQTPANKDWYRRWWAAQVVSYERQIGWVFWSWKTELGRDYRWNYRQAVEEGVIPRDPSQARGLAKC